LPEYDHREVPDQDSGAVPENDLEQCLNSPEEGQSAVFEQDLKVGPKIGLTRFSSSPFFVA
jgi:hypothetical protein